MYLYLYDSFLNDKKFATTLARIETRLTDLGIGGKICRLSPLRNIKELINDEVRNGVKTIVVVGNDKTLSQIVNLAASYNTIIGLIPVGQGNEIAEALGIEKGEAACNTLAARIIKKIDLGKINNTYFLSNIKVTNGPVTLECEEQYRITPQLKNTEITICNFNPTLVGSTQNSYFNPQDGLLEVSIRPLASNMFNFFRKDSQNLKQSVIPFKKLAIKSQGSVSIITDGQKVLKTPVKVEIAPQKLRLIVGKQRKF